MKHTIIAFFVLLFSFQSITAQQTYKAVRFKNYGLSAPEKLMALTLAGIVNRDSSRLFLENVFETWSYNQTDEKWGEIYTTYGKVEFEDITTMSALLEKFKNDIEGCITYDATATYGNFNGQSFLYQGEYAAMLGGLTNRLPVATSQLTKYPLYQSESVTVTDVFDGDADIVVTAHVENTAHEWNNTSKTPEEKYLSLVNWGKDNLLPRCNPHKFFIREITDFAIQQRMFQVDFAGTSSLDFYSMSTAKADILEYLLNYFHGKNPTTIFHIYGWISPEPMCQWLNAFGASFHESMQANISWHSAFPCDVETFTPPSKTVSHLPSLDAKHYITFIGSEGDASNWAIGLQAGAWLSTTRGEVPVNWGWNLHFFDLCRFVAKYYYETATENDGFVSVTTPLGYGYPDLWENDVWNNAIDSTRKLMDVFGVDVVYGYKHYASSGVMTFRGKTINNSFDFERYGDFQTDINCPLTMLFDPKLPLQKGVIKNNALMFNHCDDGSFYGESASASAMANRIASAVRLNKKPSFTIGGYQRFRQDNFGNRTDPTTHDMTLSMLKQVIYNLKAHPEIGAHVEIVTAQQFARLMKEQMDNPLGIGDEQVASFHLENYPNPFINQTIIAFELKQSAEVKIEVMDITGRVIEVLANEHYAAGFQQIEYNASHLKQGIYICKLTADGFTQTVKLMKQ